MAGVLLVGVLEALLVAVALSIVDVVRRSAIPHDAVLGWDERMGRYADVSVHRRARITPGVLVYRLDDRLFFANAADGVMFVFARIKTPMRHTLEGAGIVALVGRDHLYPTVRAAVEAAASAQGSPSEGDGRPPSETGR